MPTYQYHCNDCATDLEIVQKMTDPSLTVCPTCEGTLRKVFSPVGVVFKGSGFYATDNRTKGVAQAAEKLDKSDTPAKADKAEKPAQPAKPAAKPETKKPTKQPALAAA